SAGKYSRFIFCESGSYRKVVSVARKTRSDLRNPGNGADYVVIAPKAFLGEAKKLAEWRSRDSAVDPLRAISVDAADIYDEFAWGVYDPTAIRDYLKYLHEDCEPSLRYCCLIGDTTFKYKNISTSQTSKNWIPTFTFETISTDDFFTWFDTTRKPAIAIGRFCVNTMEEAKTTIAKTIDYERNPERGLWRNRALLIADDELNSNGIGQEKEFTEDIEKYDRQLYIPQSMERMKLLMIEYPLINFRKPDATDALLKLFNEGSLISHYIGHGNKDLLAHEHILVGSRDIERFNNGGRQSVFFIASCSVGSFERIDYTSLAEILHLRVEGGCVGVIAASRETFNYSNKQLSLEYYLNLFNTKTNPENRIGFALRNAKRMYFDSDIHENFSNRYIIFGDPAQRLAVPRYSLAAAPVDSLLRLQKTNIQGSARDGNNPVPYTGTLHVTARGPIIHKRYVVNAGWYVDYTIPGKVFYRGEIPISGNSFTTSLVVPKDVVSDTRESRIFLFADGGGKDASGIIDNLGIGGIDPNAPDDTGGPDIKLSFDGKTFEDGDYVKRRPTLSALITDPSGINIYGNRGHNLTITLDRSEVFVLTDLVKFVGGHSTAALEYPLPQLSPGVHILEMSAYDSHNNVTKKEVKLNVVGSETG
ncbi:MAG: type IX secretion system sortase PorU, partial [Candidatus Latescibacterota bacterium]